MSISILIFIALLNILLFLLIGRSHNRAGIYFRFTVLFVFLWTISILFTELDANDQRVLLWSRLSFFFPIFVALSLHPFMYFLPPDDIRKNIFTSYNYIISWSLLVIGIAFAVLSFTPLILARVVNLHSTFGPLHPFYTLFMLATFVYVGHSLYRSQKIAGGVTRLQFQFMLLGISVSFIIAIGGNLLLPSLGFGEVRFLGPLGLVFYISAAAYSIIAHHLFDIRVIIRRTVVYSGLLLFTLGVYSMVVFLFTTIFQGKNAFNITDFTTSLIAASFIAIGFEPIRRYLTNITDKYLFKKEYDAQDVLSMLSHQLSDSVDITQAAQSLVTLIRLQMRLTHAAVITFTFDEKTVAIKNTIQDGYQDPTILNLRPENALVLQSAREPRILITELIRRECEIRGQQDPDRQACEFLLVDLDKLAADVVLPILVKDRAIGIFLVGKKLSGDPFSREEIEFLTIVANQTANAIEKARFWEEDQMKSEFVSIASHELLTPTAAMKGYLSMILDDNMGHVDDTARRFLTKVAQSADRLAILVEDLLNVSRIESGRLKVNKKDFSLTESVSRAVEELQVNAKKKKLDLAFVMPQSQLPSVYGDPDHVYRVLVNLIGNAIKYTPRGWVRCFVTMFDANHLLFAVSDSGLGIPKEAIPQLFEKFYRADRKEIAGIQGTGLGLYISKRIVELMDGQLWVTSEIGKGTTFYFTLPIATEQRNHLQPAHTPAKTRPTGTQSA